MALANRREGSGGRRALELHAIAFRISEIDRRPLPVRAEARFLLAAIVAARRKVRFYRRGVERLDAQAEVIHVGAAPGLRAGGGTGASRDDVDLRAAGAQLRQRDRGLG